MTSPLPETVTISMEEYSNLLMIQQSADYVYGITVTLAEEHSIKDVRDMARNLLDEWTK